MQRSLVVALALATFVVSAPVRASTEVRFSDAISVDEELRSGPLSLAYAGTEPWAAASDGENWLLAMHVTTPNPSTDSSVIARILGTNGQPLALPIYVGPGNANDLRVVFDGAAYWVVWSYGGGYFAPPPAAVFAQRVSTSGKLLGARLTLAEQDVALHEQGFGFISSVEAGLADSRLGVRVCFWDYPCVVWLIDATGQEAAAPDLVIEDVATELPSRWVVDDFAVGPLEQLSPQAAAAPKGWLVAWDERDRGDGVRAVELDRQGKPRGSSFELVPTGDQLLELSRGPKGWLVVTAKVTEYDVGGFPSFDYQPRLWFLAAPGSAAVEVGASGMAASVAEGDREQSITVVASEQGWLITWLGVDGSVRATRLASDGTQVDETLLSPNGKNVGAALSGDRYRVFYARIRGAVTDVLELTLPSAGPIDEAETSWPFSALMLGPSSVAADSEHWWLLGFEQDYSLKLYSDASPYGVDYQATGPGKPLEGLVAVNGVALAALNDHFVRGALQMGVAEPGGQLELIDGFVGRWHADISEPSGNQALLVFEQDQVEAWGPLVRRVAASVVTVGEPLPEAVGGAPAEEAPAEGGSAGNVGSDDEPPPEHASGGTPSAGSPNRAPRATGGCSFHGATPAGGFASAALLLLLVRRRRARVTPRR